MLSGIEFIGCLGSVVTVLATIDDVNSSGAVSPAARAAATTLAVTMPLIAAGSTIVSSVRARVAPSAYEASCRLDGTSASTSSTDRAIRGTITIDRAIAAAHAL